MRGRLRARQRHPLQLAPIRHGHQDHLRYVDGQPARRWRDGRFAVGEGHDAGADEGAAGARGDGWPDQRAVGRYRQQAVVLIEF